MINPTKPQAPAVSVIIATYNAGPLLAQALDALAAQSLPPELIEIIVVDDGSTDGTWSYLTELESPRSNIKIFQQQHTGGPSAGRNRARHRGRRGSCARNRPCPWNHPTG